MKIGKYTFYDNQSKAGNEYFEHLINNRIPVLCSQPQMGKTGSLIVTVKDILDYCLIENIDLFKIYHIQNEADNELRQQTTADYELAFGEGYKDFSYTDLFGDSSDDKQIINVIHRAALKKEIKTLNKAITYFIMFDEAHTALNKDGNIDKFEKSLNDMNIIHYKGYCSATPFVFNILGENTNNLPIPKFEKVVLSPSDNYTGIDTIFNSNRIKESKKMFDEGMTAFSLEEVIPDFISKINQDGPGFLLLRSSMDDLDIKVIVDYIQNHYKIPLTFRAVNCEKKNINKLEKILSSRPNKSEIILIKGTLRLGKRLPKKYIRCVVDTPAFKQSNTATVIQSLLGRSCGNNNENNNFNIYCDMRNIENYIAWWNDISKGLPITVNCDSHYNDSNSEERSENCDIIIVSSEEEAQKYSYITKNHPKTGIATVSGQNKIDIADKILKKRTFSTPLYAAYIDAPNEANENHKSSWKKLLDMYPDIQGKWVVFNPLKTPIVYNNIKSISSDQLTEDCMFKSE